jgi:hypothetical protein
MFVLSLPVGTLRKWRIYEYVLPRMYRTKGKILIREKEIKRENKRCWNFKKKVVNTLTSYSGRPRSKFWSESSYPVLRYFLRFPVSLGNYWNTVSPATTASIIIIIISGSTALVRTLATSHRRFRNLSKTPLDEWSARRKGLYLHPTTQQRNIKINIHALSGIRTHDASNQEAKT